jgi:hypothetical protein
MGIRVAAVLAAAVIAIALGAAILATHRGPVGNVPAGADPSVKAYQDMISSNYDAVVNLDSPGAVCNTVDDTGCQANLNAAEPVYQKWISDLTAFQTPARFAALDGLLRRHLNDAITQLQAGVAYQKTRNVEGFTLAYEGGFYEREWLDPAVSTIEGSYPRVAGSYADALAVAKQSLEGCINQAPGPADLGCEHLYHADVCAKVGLQACANDADAYAARIQGFLIGILQNPAPTAIAAKDRQIQTALSQLDADIVAVTDGLLSGDSAKTASAEASFVADLTLAVNYIRVAGY